MHVPDLGALLQEAQMRRMALEATGVCSSPRSTHRTRRTSSGASS